MKLLCLAINKNEKIKNIYFEQSCIRNNIEYVVINLKKTEKFNRVILNNLHEIDNNYLILIVDYSNTIFLGNHNLILDNFNKIGLPFIFSSDNEIKYLLDNFNYKNFFNDDLCLNSGKKSIPNSKYFIGLKEDLIDLFEKIINFNTKMNNSNILHDLCKYGYKYSIDVNNKIFFVSNNNCFFNENILKNISNTYIKKTYISDILNKLYSKVESKYDKISKPLILCNLNINDMKRINDSMIFNKKIKIISNDKYVFYLLIIVIFVYLIISILYI